MNSGPKDDLYGFGIISAETGRAFRHTVKRIVNGKVSHAVLIRLADGTSAVFLTNSEDEGINTLGTIRDAYNEARCDAVGCNVGVGNPCFSGQDTVQVKVGAATERRRRMDKLHIGDSGLTSQGYSKVYSFGHKDTSTSENYLQMHSQSTTATKIDSLPLEISADHLIYIAEEGENTIALVPARKVKIGDLLIGADGKPSKIVVSIEIVTRRGLYSPLTATGDIVVNDILASNYVSRKWIQPLLLFHSGSKFLHWMHSVSPILYGHGRCL